MRFKGGSPQAKRAAATVAAPIVPAIDVTMTAGSDVLGSISKGAVVSESKARKKTGASLGLNSAVTAAEFKDVTDGVSLAATSQYGACELWDDKRKQEFY